MRYELCDFDDMMGRSYVRSITSDACTISKILYAISPLRRAHKAHFICKIPIWVSQSTPPLAHYPRSSYPIHYSRADPPLSHPQSSLSSSNNRIALCTSQSSRWPLRYPTTRVSIPSKCIIAACRANMEDRPIAHDASTAQAESWLLFRVGGRGGSGGGLGLHNRN